MQASQPAASHTLTSAEKDDLQAEQRQNLAAATAVDQESQRGDGLLMVASARIDTTGCSRPLLTLVLYLYRCECTGARAAGYTTGAPALASRRPTELSCGK